MAVLPTPFYVVVVYFEQLSGAAHNQKLVDILYFAFFSIEHLIDLNLLQRI